MSAKQIIPNAVRLFYLADSSTSSDRNVSEEHPIRCVDVVSHKLVPITPLDRYVCLSYVWGDLDLAVRRGSFFGKADINMEELPRTIQDAITLVRNLGETYLWTDILCRDQSDDDDLNPQIGQMDLIFETALCTLVALDGRNADSGLPGVRPGSRKGIGYSVIIDGANLVAGPHIPLDKVINDGYWRTRRWTAQEELLSRRCLFFGDHEVILHCRESIGRETINAPNVDRSCRVLPVRDRPKHTFDSR